MIFRDGAILLATLLAVATAAAQAPGATPVFKLFLPASVASEQVDVDYALYGDFGAYSNFSKAKPDSQFVGIPLAVQGTIAQEIKMIAWAPGCKVATFDVKIEGLDLQESYFCNPLPFVLLAGQVDKPVLLRQQGLAEVRIEYLAAWACEFFGFADCMVPQFSIGTAKLDPTGHFETNLPDFESDPDCKRSSVFGGFQFAVRESDTWDRDLVPQLEHLRTLEGELKPASAYPNPTMFVVRKPN